MTTPPLFILALLTIAQPALAQSAASAIRPVSSHQISVDQATHAHAESFIAVDPKDPRHLLATAIVMVKGTDHSYPYASFDGGKTWARGRIIGDSSVAAGGDPIIYIAPSGSSFFCTLTRVDGVSRT